MLPSSLSDPVLPWSWVRIFRSLTIIKKNLSSNYYYEQAEAGWQHLWPGAVQRGVCGARGWGQGTQVSVRWVSSSGSQVQTHNDKWGVSISGSQDQTLYDKITIIVKKNSPCHTLIVRSVMLRVPGPTMRKTQTNNDRFRSPSKNENHNIIFTFSDSSCVLCWLFWPWFCAGLVSTQHTIYLISFNKNWFCGRNKRRERWIIYWWKKSKCSKLMINWHPQFLKQLFERSSNM